MAFGKSSVVLGVLSALFFLVNVSTAASWDYNVDYVVVGTGAGGSALIKTLLETLPQNTKVIGVEAGPNFDHEEFQQNPLHQQEQYSSKTDKYDWQLKTVYDDRTYKHYDTRVGRMLGGSTGHFTFQCVKPSNASLAVWEAVGGPAWSVSRLVEEFTLLETFIDEETNTNLPGRGTSGPINIRRPVRGPTTGVGSLANLLAQWTAEAANLTVQDDYNSPQGPGYGTFPRYDLFQTPERRRESGSTAFLGSDVMHPDGQGKGPLGGNKRLTVLLRTTVLRVVFQNNRAVGVEAVQDGKFIRIKARKEVILAGSLLTSHLLEVSGIGNASRLASLGIPVVYNNPNVGLHLKNHPSIMLLYLVNSTQFGGPAPPSDPEALMAGGGFFPEVLADGSFAPADPNKPRAFQTVLSGTSAFPDLLVFVVAQEQPVSKGWNLVQSRDPLTNSLIDQRLFTDGDDLEQMARFLYYFVQETLAPYLNAQFAQLGGYFAPFTGVTPHFNSLQEAKDFVIANQGDASHYCGSNRMATSASTGVVDWAGRVYGVQGLRIADSSIFPEVPDANTAFTSFLVGRNIGKLIAEGH